MKGKVMKGLITSSQSYLWGKHNITGIFTILLAVFLISGCITLAPKAIGPQFSPKETTPANTATVYIYYPVIAQGTKGYYIWYGKPISPEEALKANEGTILLYPGWAEGYSETYPGAYEKTGAWFKTARYYDLDIIVNDQDEQEDSQKKIEFNVIDKRPGWTRFNSIDIKEILDHDIALAQEDPENYLMNAKLAPHKIISKSYFAITLEPGETNFWFSKDQLLDGQLPPYVYPNILTIDLKPDSQYFLMVSPGKSKLTLIPETTAISPKRTSILDCRRSDVKIE